MLSAAKPFDGSIVKAQAPAMKALESFTALGLVRRRAFKKVYFDKPLYLDSIELQQDLECLVLRL